MKPPSLSSPIASKVPATAVASSSGAPFDIADHVTIRRGDAPGIVVLLPAAGAGPRSLERLGKRLVQAGWQTATPAFEWQGVSLIVARGDRDAFAVPVEIATRLLQRRDAGPCVLAGHSMGGLVALKTLLAGVRADALVLFEPIVLSLLDSDDPEDRAASAWDASVIADFREKLAAGNPEAGVRRFIEAYGEQAWPELPEVARADLVARAARILADAEATNACHVDREALTTMTVPTLLISGNRSPAVLGRMAARLAALVPDIEQSTIEGAGHMGPVSSAEKIGDVIAEFLCRRLGARSQTG
jgi:pimeloyl-ACP methyl ester carboxylesterase